MSWTDVIGGAIMLLGLFFADLLNINAIAITGIITGGLVIVIGGSIMKTPYE